MQKPINIAIDAMGGDNSPYKTIEGINIHSKNSNDVIYKIFGNKNIVEPLIKKVDLSNSRYEIIHTENTIKDTDTALSAAKKGKDTSMWLSIESLKKNNSDATVSAGNTGALFVIAKLNLNMIENIEKPALSGLWPNKKGMNIVLDLGANIECNEKNLVDFSLMGAALHKALYENEVPKVAILNIGSEEVKGNVVIKNTYQKLNNKQNPLYEFHGYIEGNQIMEGNVNVIVTDGFTGNVALKTAEGTANFITSELKKAINSNIIGKISSLINLKNLNKFKNKLEVNIDHLNSLLQKVVDSPPFEICLADTIGAAAPNDVLNKLDLVRDFLPDSLTRLHCHNSRNLGLANAYAAIVWGVDALDASTAGLGGCPFSVAATGNIPSEDLIYMLQRMGIENRVELRNLLEISSWVCEKLGRESSGMLQNVGIFPPTINSNS